MSGGKSYACDGEPLKEPMVYRGDCDLGAPSFGN